MRHDGPVNLTLTATTLSDKGTNGMEGTEMRLRLTELRKALKAGYTQVNGYFFGRNYQGQPHLPYNLALDETARQIGCCTFTKYSWNRLLTAAKVK